MRKTQKKPAPKRKGPDMLSRLKPEKKVPLFSGGETAVFTDNSGTPCHCRIKKVINVFDRFAYDIEFYANLGKTMRVHETDLKKFDEKANCTPPCAKFANGVRVKFVKGNVLGVDTNLEWEITDRQLSSVGSGWLYWMVCTNSRETLTQSSVTERELERSTLNLNSKPVTPDSAPVFIGSLAPIFRNGTLVRFKKEHALKGGFDWLFRVRSSSLMLTGEGFLYVLDCLEQGVHLSLDRAPENHLEECTGKLMLVREDLVPLLGAFWRLNDRERNAIETLVGLLGKKGKP